MKANDEAQKDVGSMEVQEQAFAWRTIFDWCEAHGCDYGSGNGSGIEHTISFLNRLVEPAPSTPESCKCDSPEEFAYNVSTGPVPQGSACIVNTETGEKRIVPYEEAFPSTPEPFKAGDLVVCVKGWPDGGLMQDQLYRITDASGWIYIDAKGGTRGGWHRDRFRHATAAEIAAHRASTVAIHELNDGVPSRIDVEVPQIAIKVEPEYVVTSKPTTEQYIVDGHDRLISQEGSNVTLFQRTYDIGSQEGRDALQKVVAMIQDVLESKHEPDLGPQRGPVSVAQIEAQTKAVRREMEWPPELVAQVEQKRQDDEGWIEWDKGYCPPGCEDKVVEIRTERYGDLCKRPARMTHWERKGDGNDITHYRVVEQPKPIPVLAPQGTEARVCQDIAERQALGIAKYGTTVEKNPLCLLEWLEHAYQECLDQAVYLKRAIEKLEANGEPCGVRE